MKKYLLSILSIATLFVSAQIEQPKLVVGIVIDQMRAEYLYRFNADFGNDGFKKLMKEGYVFENTHFNYMPTYTAPGHSSVYTGTTPAIHGIVGNTWYNKEEGKKVYCTSDDSVMSVGMKAEAKTGRMSPRRLKTTTITDEVKMATNQKGKVIGVSVKDRGAILPVGHYADAAYWINDEGHFITSTYYMNELPKWVQKFNKQELAKKYVKQGWELLKDPKEYNESLPDNNDFERVFKSEKTPTFPHNLQKIADGGEGVEIVKTSPFGNNLVAEMAKAAIEGENLGQDDVVDFLAVSFSSTDYVGHSYGPRSMEVQDTYLRLDQTLAEMLKYLDKKVGKGNYLLFLTADHAAAENPNHLKSLRYDVKNLDSDDFESELKEHLKNKYGDDLLVNYSNQNIFLDEKLITQKGLNYNKIMEDVVNFGMTKPYVKRVYTRKNILAGNPIDYHLSLISKGYDPKQNGDAVVLLQPEYMEYYHTGTTHGSTYTYDTHVPNLWYGWHIKPGATADRKTITQIAPTVSALLHITFPNGSKAEVLTELED